METLTDVRDIGVTLVEKLPAAGIETPLALKRLGRVEALRHIRGKSQDDEPCMNMRCALE